MTSKREIFRLLDNNALVSSYQVLEFREDPNSFFLKIQVVFSNKSVLYTKEFFSTNKRKYSFHWQDQNDETIIRWDNAPDHENIISFPHHKHVGKDIFPSSEMGLSDVLNYILKALEGKQT
jgi:hypothetical protein